jgi:archaellum component FlaF (FlaF/FlaG flagellin family)
MKNYAIIAFVFLLSCKEAKNEKSNHVNLKNSDEIYKRVSKIPDSLLTKIEIPELIDLDTIENSSAMVNITIKNKGSRTLTSFIVKPPCACNDVSKYDSIMAPHQSQTITVNMKFDTVGNFYQGITIYGSFYPYIKKIYIQGFRR